MSKYGEIYTPTDEVIGSIAGCFLLAIIIVIGIFVFIYHFGGYKIG